MSVECRPVEFGVATHTALLRQRSDHSNPIGDLGSRLRRWAQHIGGGRPIEMDHEVESIEQRTGNSTGIPSSGRGRAPTADVATHAARAWVHRRYQQHPSWLLRSRVSASNPHNALFERLTERIKDRGRKLTQLIEKQDPACRSAHLAGAGMASPSPNQRRHRGRMVRSSKRGPINQPARWEGEA